MLEQPGHAPRTLPLCVQDLRYGIAGRELLGGLSFTVQAGSVTVILGPNGAGKTLLMRLCHGLLKPSAGRILWRDATPVRARRDQAMVFQKPVVLRRSVAANVDYPLAVRGMARAERRLRLQRALEATNLLQLAHSPARPLSGGEKQRLAMARAWALQPEVLLLDEPTSNLDPRSTRDIEKLLLQMHEQGTTVIMTTHDLMQARRLARHILFLNRGRLIADAQVTEFFTRSEHPDVRSFLNGDLLA